MRFFSSKNLLQAFSIEKKSITQRNFKQVLNLIKCTYYRKKSITQRNSKHVLNLIKCTYELNA
jgi:hypothetical protein